LSVQEAKDDFYKGEDIVANVDFSGQFLDFEPT
jgi:hypothetical protein